MNKKIWFTGLLCIAAIFITVTVYKNFFMEESVSVLPEAPAAGVEEASGQTVFRPVQASAERIVRYENDIYSAEFSSDGGELVSLRLKEYQETDGETTELVFSGGSGLYPFSFHPGGYGSKPLRGGMETHLYSGEGRIVFSGIFTDDDGRGFALRKTYSFVPEEYLIVFDIELEGLDGGLPPIERDGIIYSAGFGPQLGPEFGSLERSYIYRYFCLEDGGEKKNLAVAEGEDFLRLEGQYRWTGVEGRYFACAVTVPETVESIVWDESPAGELPRRNSFQLERGGPADADGAGPIRDRYFVYFGPKHAETLEAAAASVSSLSGGDIDAEYGLLSARTGILKTLADALKAVLGRLYRVVPNYGVVIILFTLAVQLIIYPVSRKTYDNAIRMQLLGPEIGELKKRFKWSTDRLNREVADLFEKNGVRPRSALLPFVIHLPLFMLLYVLLLSDVDFRSALFITGWIPDVALPEHIADISPYAVPLTGWTKIRILPLVMLALSLFQSRFIQAPADSIGSMRVMSYLVPVFMFIVIYNMPSGAVLYWITMTFTNLVVQYFIKRKYANLKKQGIAG